jgi:hypothetical protein
MSFTMKDAGTTVELRPSSNDRTRTPLPPVYVPLCPAEIKAFSWSHSGVPFEVLFTLTGSLARCCCSQVDGALIGTGRRGERTSGVVLVLVATVTTMDTSMYNANDEGLCAVGTAERPSGTRRDA